MAVDFTRPLGQGLYTNTYRALLPGLLIGLMFLAIAFASRSAADFELRKIEKTLTARTSTPEDLREEISLHDSVTGAAPIKANLKAATESGLRKLNNPDDAAALERVSIEIDLPQSNAGNLSGGKLPVELLEVLSRRASPLQLELTVRVAPANAGIAIQWFDVVRRNAEPGQIVDISQIAVGLDKSMPMDKLRLDVLRTKTMVMMKESPR